MSQSGENNGSDDQDPTSGTILELMQTKEWLQNQKLEYSAALKNAENNTEPSSNDQEKLLESIAGLHKGMQDSSTDLMLKNLMMYRVHSGQTLMQYLFPMRPQDGAGDASQTTEQEQKQKVLTDLVAKQTALVTEVLKTHKENKAKLEKLDQVKRDNIALKHTVRELFFTLQKEKEAISSQNPSTSRDEAVRWAQESVKGLHNKVELVRNSLQGLILGSGIHWAQDPELTELLLSLGMPLDIQL